MFPCGTAYALQGGAWRGAGEWSVNPDDAPAVSRGFTSPSEDLPHGRSCPFAVVGPSTGPGS